MIQLKFGLPRGRMSIKNLYNKYAIYNIKNIIITFDRKMNEKWNN